MRRKVRLTETDLHRIIKESVKSILKEDNSISTQPYYWDISELRRSKDGEWETYRCIEDSATSDEASKSEFETAEEAFQDGLKNLRFYNDGHYMLEVYTFTPNGAGDYVTGYAAEIHDGTITEY